jgi:hypothetical protein
VAAEARTIAGCLPMEGRMTRYAVCTISPEGYPHSAALAEVADSLVGGLAALGHDVIRSPRTDHSDRRQIVLGAHLLPRYPQALAGDVVLYNLEQIHDGTQWLGPGYLELLGRHRVWDYAQRNIDALAAKGIGGVRLLPIGYVPELSRIAPADEDIDVLLVGSLNERRMQLVNAIRRKGLRVDAVFGSYGPERDRLYARARIVLNAHFYESKVLELVRVSYLLANRRFVVSERGADPAVESEFADGILFADYDDIPAVCAAHVGAVDARRRIAERGFEIMRSRDLVEFLRAVV